MTHPPSKVLFKKLKLSIPYCSNNYFVLYLQNHQILNNNMQDYSLDIQIESIHSAQTKEYFKEVISSYYSNNYRATIVTLYSVVIYDLVQKLEVLRDTYEDGTAQSILDRIEAMQTKNPKSPDWETKLIDLIKAETKFLDPAEGLHIDTLQSLRHLCAHPVRKSNYELFSPNKETVRSHLRNMLESVLTKRPLLYKAIFDDFIKDISKNKYRLISDESKLDRYISSKYLDNISFDGIKQIIKSLWKITLNLDNPDANKNREINLKTLALIIRKNQDKVLPIIQQEYMYYSNINIKFIYEIISLANEHHNLYNILKDSEKDEISSRISSSADLHAYAWFKNKTIEQHTNILQSEDYYILYLNFSDSHIDAQTLVYLEKILRAVDNNKANIFIANMYRKSSDYDTADERFNNLINPNLQYFSQANFELLLSNIEQNSQLYDRRNARSDHKKIKSEIEKRFPNQINYKDYPYFERKS